MLLLYFFISLISLSFNIFVKGPDISLSVTLNHPKPALPSSLIVLSKLSISDLVSNLSKIKPRTKPLLLIVFFMNEISVSLNISVKS